MRLNFNTVVTSYFKTFPGDMTPTAGELEQWDQVLLNRYGGFLAPAMTRYGLDIEDPDQVNWVITLAELTADMTASAKLDRACHFYRMLGGAAAVPLMSMVNKEALRIADFAGPMTEKPKVQNSSAKKSNV